VRQVEKETECSADWRSGKAQLASRSQNCSSSRSSANTNSGDGNREAATSFAVAIMALMRSAVALFEALLLRGAQLSCRLNDGRVACKKMLVRDSSQRT
jgi:phage-related tail protein